MKKFNFLLMLTLVISYSCKTHNPDVTVDELKKHIMVIASDEMEGRKSGSIGGKASADYIRDEFNNMGLELFNNDGFQRFELVSDVKAGDNNAFSYNNKTFSLGLDFTPLSFSSNVTLTAEAIFVGYGFDFETDSVSWNDYANIDVKDKIVFVLQGDPEYDKHTSAFIPFEGERSKTLKARDKGASAVVFITPVAMNKKDELAEMHFDKTASDAGLPVVHITRNTMNSLLESNDLTIEDIETQISDTRITYNYEFPNQMSLQTEVIQQMEEAKNVIAIIHGTDDVLKDEYIAIGAHYDHLGYGGPGSGSREPDTNAIHNGADDNASGVGTILELAGYFSENPTKRSIIFIAFDAEELGLIGSKYFMNNTDIANTSFSAMFNFDMVGRLKKDERVLSIGGTGTSKEGEGILTKFEDTTNFKLLFSKEGYGPSDHAAFYASDIPVFFVSTGAHADYHTPIDDVQFLDFDAQKLITDYATNVIAEVANLDAQLTYQEAGVKSRKRHGYRFKVTLGIIPDFAGRNKLGMAIDGVRKGGPASSGGMMKGDIIVAINGQKVGNIYDYMDRLKTLKEGTSTTIEIIRDGKNEVLIVQL